MIVAQVLTDQHTDDPSQVGPLLDQVEEKIGKVTADGAYDGTPAPLRRQSTGAFMPETKWLHNAESSHEHITTLVTGFNWLSPPESPLQLTVQTT